MAVPMVDKCEKYWDIANKLLEIATILDPRYKMKSIEYYYKLLYDPFVAELRIESAKKSFLELFSLSKKGYPSLGVPTSTLPSIIRW